MPAPSPLAGEGWGEGEVQTETQPVRYPSSPQTPPFVIKVRQESVRVNAEFGAIEHDPKVLDLIDSEIREELNAGVS